MANSLYDLGRQKFLEGSIAILSDTIKVALVTDSYTPDLVADEFYDDLGGNTAGTDQTLSGKSSTAGVFDATDVTFASVSPGSDVAYLVIYKSTGTPSTSPLIGIVDTATGVPLTTDGGDVNVTWSNLSNRIFKL